MNEVDIEYEIIQGLAKHLGIKSKWHEHYDALYIQIDNVHIQLDDSDPNWIVVTCIPISGSNILYRYSLADPDCFDKIKDKIMGSWVMRGLISGE